MTGNIKRIKEIGFMPLAATKESSDAVSLAKALLNGGIGIIEVTFRTEAAAESISRISREVPEILVGAGTVHTIEQAEIAVRAGAGFIVTPAFNPAVIQWCTDNHIDIIPGIATPADIEMAMKAGLSICKFFPAEVYGGVKALKALAGPFADIEFIPTGGVSLDNMNDYLSLPNVAAVGGSFMAPARMVAEKNWNGISAICREIIKKQLGFELLHIGVNTKDPDDAYAVSKRLGELFLKDIKEFAGAYFVGSMAEVVKGKFLGAMGHIAIITNDIDRAVAYYERNGIGIDHSTAVRDETGKIIAIYLKEEVGGFALHLRRRQ